MFTAIHALHGRTAVLVMFALVLLASVARAEEVKDPRLPVPDAQQLTAAEKVVKDVYAKEFRASDTRSRATLAKKLFDASANETGPAERFVLLRDARQIAVSANDWPTSVSASVESAKAFQIDPFSLLTELLNSKAAADPVGRKPLVQACLNAIRRAFREKHFDAAFKFATAAEQSLTRSKATDAAKQFSDLRQSLILQKQISDDKDAALVKLKDKPDDPAANLALGRGLCFLDNDWENGLQKLAAGSDPALKALASKDLTYPRMPDDKVTLAGSWWDYAASQSGFMRAGARARANRWYSRSVHELTGLSRALAERRISDTLADAVELSSLANARRSPLLPANAKMRSLILVCDASKSMALFNAQRDEVVKAVSGLRDEQPFNVIFFKDGRAFQFAPALASSAPEIKQEFFAFLNKMTQGTTPAGGMDAAITEAIAEKPTLIYILSAFQFEGAKDIPGVLQKLNIAKIKVNAIAFGDDASASDIGKQIAADNQGAFKIVKETDAR